MFRWFGRAALLLTGAAVTPALGAAVLQCVPYARIVSGVEIRGDALNWWGQAQDRYARGNTPKKGAVLAFRANGRMVLGHVAVVSKVLGERRILIRHANWSKPGAIEEDVLAIDVSDAGDWSAVRVWYSPSDQMGARTNPTYGFIYPAKAKLHKFEADPKLGESMRFAKVDEDRWDEEELPRQMRVQVAKADAVRKPVDKPLVQPARMQAVAPITPVIRRARHEPRIEYADVSNSRTLGDIIADVKRETRMR
jgi:hypothetical protein